MVVVGSIVVTGFVDVVSFLVDSWVVDGFGDELSGVLDESWLFLFFVVLLCFLCCLVEFVSKKVSLKKTWQTQQGV